MLHLQAGETRVLYKSSTPDVFRRAAINLAIVVVLMVSALLISILLAGNALLTENMFPSGTTVNGYDIGGMPFNDGIELVLEANRDKLESFAVPLSYNGNPITLSAEELDISDHIKALLYDASYSASEIGPLSGVATIVRPKAGQAIDLSPILDATLVQSTLQGVLSESEAGYEDAAVEEYLFNQPMTGTEQIQDEEGNVQVFLTVNNRVFSEFVTKLAAELYPAVEEPDEEPLKAAETIKYNDIIEKYAERYSLDPAYVAAVIFVESMFEADSKSAVGAVGLMQIMPSTGRWIAEQIGLDASSIDLFDPETNIHIGCWYLSYLQSLFDGNVHTATIAYNAGPVRVNNWLKDSNYSSDGKVLDTVPFEETRVHTEKIESYFEIYQRVYKT